ncbi:MAG: tellurite resistance protein TerA [Pseudomonas sp.]|jgi:tellurite resistance protein TerA
MTVLTPGANTSIPDGALTVTVSYSPVAGADLDVSAFQLLASGKVRGDTDMCFYGQKSVGNGALQMTEVSAGRAVFKLDPNGIEATVEKIALTATIDENKAKFAAFSGLQLNVAGGAGTPIEAPIATQGMQETALILGEFYRRQGAWKFRLVAQGFAGGLAPLAEHFGVEIAAAPAPTPAPAPVPTPTPVPAATPAKISLSKITLDKTRSSISLEKTDGNFGEIKINLNWNRGAAGKGGILSGLMGKPKGIDLDLGCLYELQDGTKMVVQALGKQFGKFNQKPFIELMGDDRTGAVSDGEWLRINGQHWQEIRRIVIYAFIYEGAPDWMTTDGVVTLYVPGQAPIEVRLSEEGGRQGMCAIALLENTGGAVKVNREVKFFPGHQELDNAYRWGMRWSAGSK